MGNEGGRHTFYGSFVPGARRVFTNENGLTTYSVEGAEGKVSATFEMPTCILDAVFMDLERQYCIKFLPEGKDYL